jgi:hypothetical protein
LLVLLFLVVCKQGSPLIPDNLKYVSAKTAGKIIIVSDSSRASAEADAQALRVAVLLDEMWGPREPRGLVVVELKTGVSAQLVRFHWLFLLNPPSNFFFGGGRGHIVKCNYTQ